MIAYFKRLNSKELKGEQEDSKPTLKTPGKSSRNHRTTKINAKNTARRCSLAQRLGLQLNKVLRGEQENSKPTLKTPGKSSRNHRTTKINAKNTARRCSLAQRLGLQPNEAIRKTIVCLRNREAEVSARIRTLFPHAHKHTYIQVQTNEKFTPASYYVGHDRSRHSCLRRIFTTTTRARTHSIFGFATSTNSLRRYPTYSQQSTNLE